MCIRDRIYRADIAGSWHPIDGKITAGFVAFGTDGAVDMSGAHGAIIVAAELSRRRWMTVYTTPFYNDFGSVWFDQLAG